MTNLRMFRANHGLKQNELASKIGISQVYVSQLESGVRPLTDEVRYKIEEIFGDGCLDQFECEDIIDNTDEKMETYVEKKVPQSKRDSDLVESLRATIELLKDEMAKKDTIIEKLQDTNTLLLNKLLDDAK